MNSDLLSSSEAEVEETASAIDVAVEDYFGPDVLADVTQLYVDAIGQDDLLCAYAEVRHARRVRAGDARRGKR
ncbi:MAG: hypothetical protein H7X76_04015 [Prolixibacteraceae bacterium]|nr:hypothetical protein [Burkholderiales bacterium]